MDGFSEFLGGVLLGVCSVIVFKRLYPHPAPVRTTSTPEKVAPLVVTYSVRRGLSTERYGKGVPETLDDLLTPDHVVWTHLNKRASPTSLRRQSVADVLQCSRPRLQTVVAAQICTEWGYDVIQLEEASSNRALQIICEAVFKHYRFEDREGDAKSESQVSPTVWTTLVDYIAVTYDGDPKRQNIYHNRTHAADVVQTVSALCSQKELQTVLHTQDVWVLCVSAMIHDYMHMGVTNAFLVNALHPIAVMFSDDSVQERHHLYNFFVVIRSNPTMDIFKGFSCEEVRYFRSTITQLVLSTDLATSFRVHTRFDEAMSVYEETGSVDTSDIRLVLMQMVIKCADVSHAAKPLALHYQWSKRVSEEFFAQGDRERDEGFPLSAICQRATVNVPESQCGFLDYVVRKPFTTLERFTGTTSLSTQYQRHIRENHDYWNGAVGTPIGEYPPMSIKSVPE